MTPRVALCALLFAAIGPAQEETPITWTFGAPAIEGKPAPGAALQVRVAAKIKEGWHLYSLKKLEGGPVATRISLPDGQPFELTGEIDAPPPITQRDPNFDMEVGYYTDSVEFTLPVKVADSAKGGQQKLRVAARFQSCNDKLCLPPRTVIIETPLELK